MPPPNHHNGQGPPYESKAARKRKAKQARGLSLGGGGGQSPPRGGPPGSYPASFDPYEEDRLDPMEQAKRQRRAGRFEGSGTSLAERADRWNTPQPTVSVDGETGDISLDYTVVGTCDKVEKKYLRLTAAPDPRTVRPEPVLKAAVEMVRAKYDSYGEERGQEQYIYLWEQMKSVRQDLTVQRIRNAFTVEVYEMHARICLEFDDQVEFNQCQAQLAQLYGEGLGTKQAQREFTSYNVLFNVGKGATNNVSDLMLAMTFEDHTDAFISFALAVRAAEALGDYTTLFRLYNQAPGHSSYVMDTFVDRYRLASVKVILKAYAPTVPASYVSANLGFESLDECVFFLEDHGCVIVEKAEGGDGAAAEGEGIGPPLPPIKMVDCKASRAALVDHSIAARQEEERKQAERKAERTNFANGL